MVHSLPTPLRAAAGLASVAFDETKKLPRRLVALPVVAVSTAMQASLKAQQHYAELVVRGDDLLGRLGSDLEQDNPPWAQFDDDDASSAEHSELAEQTVDDRNGFAGQKENLPLVDYDDLSLPQLRARLKQLSEGQLVDLLEYEQTHADRASYVTMLRNRLNSIRTDN